MNREGWLIAFAAGVASFLLGIQANDFPFYYHIDEPTKTAQLVEGYRNFNHPLLLLTVSDLVTEIFGVERSHQGMVEVGRTVSALFTGLACFAMTLLAFLKGGRWAAAWVGFFLVTHWDLFEKAHYLKEDPALCFGLAVTFLGIGVFRRFPGWKSAVFLGIGIGLATSGKYVGVMALPLALPVIALYGRSKFKEVGVALAALVATVAIINYPLLTPGGIAQFKESLGLETSKATQGTWAKREGMNWGFFERIAQVARAHMLPFFTAWGIALLLRRSRERPGYDDWLVFLFPFVLAGILAFSTKTSGRYFLPGVMAICYATGMGLGYLTAALQDREKRWAKPVLIGLSVFAIAGAGERLWKYGSRMLRDPRVAMATYIRDELPPDAIVIQGYGVHLPDLTEQRYRDARQKVVVPQKIISASHPPDRGTLDELRADGVTHVAVTGQNYERYTKGKGVPKEKERERYNHRKTFYKTLFKSGDLVWHREADRVGTHNPPLKLYSIVPVEGQQ